MTPILYDPAGLGRCGSLHRFYLANPTHNDTNTNPVPIRLKETSVLGFHISQSTMASRSQIDDDDDFGGDFPGANATRVAGSKRGFGDLDDDEDDIFGSKKANIKVEETAPGVATGMILSLRESLQSCKDALETCQSELEDAKLENQKWHSAFQKESFISSGSSVEPRVVVNYLQNLKSSEESLREQLDKAKKKEAAFIVTIAKREQEIADLKAAVRDLRSQLKPLSMQARRLLLDPAIHEEFMRLKNLVEEKDKKVKELQDNVAAVNFTPQSKMGKMLMAKCKTLQDENEEIGNQAKEGKIHELYTKLALQKAQNVELRSECEGLCKRMEELTNDVEISNETVLILKEKLSDKEAEIKRLRQQLQQYDPVEEKTETFAAANTNDIDEDVTVAMDLEPELEPETEEL